MEQLGWLKSYLDTGTMVAMLALSLATNWYLFRKLGKERDDHMETVREVIPLLTNVTKLADNLSDFVQWMKSMRQRWQ